MDMGSGVEPFPLSNVRPFPITAVKPYLREGKVESSQPKIRDRVDVSRPLGKAYYPETITNYDSAEGK